MKNLLLFLIGLVLLIACGNKPNNKKGAEQMTKPMISFSFDDGSTHDLYGMSSNEWNGKILNSLKKHSVKAVFFVLGQGLDSEKGREILTAWDNDGHQIASHTYSHLNLNSDNVTVEAYMTDILKCDSMVQGYTNYYKRFRYPYLAEGNTFDKRNKIRAFLSKNGFEYGHATLDGSDWYITGRLEQALAKDSLLDIAPYRNYYVKHLFERAQYFDSLGVLLTNRRIKHVMLMHHNLTSALFLDDLIQYFKNNGWDVIDADLAYKDHIYDHLANTMPVSGTLLPGLAQSKGLFDEYLKDSNGDGQREKKQMDELGL